MKAAADDHGKRIASSLYFSYLSQFIGQALTLSTEIILARLVLPSDWGLFGIATMVVMITAAVRDLGIPYQLVRENREDLYGTALTLVVTSSILCTLILAVAAPVGVRLMAPEYARLPAVLQVLSLVLLFDGLANLARFIIDKKLVVRVSLVPFIVRNVTFALVGIALGALGAGIWSLVAAQMAATLVYAGMLWARALPLVKLRLGLNNAGLLLSRSLPLFAIWFFTIVTTYIDNGILSLRFSLETVGYYFLAYKWAAIRTEEVFYPALSRVVYPALVAVRADPKRRLSAYRLSSAALLSLEGLVAINIFFNAELVVDILMGSGWEKAVPLVRLLSLFPLIKPFSRFGVELMKVTGHDGKLIAMRIVNLTCLVIGGWLLTGKYGPEGMAYANYIVLGNLVSFFTVARLIGFKETARLGARFLFIVAVPFTVLGAVYFLTPHDLVLRLQLSALLTPIIAWFYYAVHGKEYRGFFKEKP